MQKIMAGLMMCWLTGCAAPDVGATAAAQADKAAADPSRAASAADVAAPASGQRCTTVKGYKRKDGTYVQPHQRCT